MVLFIYDFKNFNQKPATIQYEIEIPYLENVAELAHRIVKEKMDEIMTFLDSSRGLFCTFFYQRIFFLIKTSVFRIDCCFEKVHRS